MPRDKQAILQELLVLRCQRGDREAFEELVRQWEERLFYYIRRLVGSEQDAWDVLQQTWLKVFKEINSLRNRERLPIWLYQLARSAVLSHWRGHYRLQSRLENDADVSSLAAAEETDRLEDCETVHHGLSRISIAHREVLTLHFLEDFPLEQMAEILGVPDGTVKSRLFHARRALRAAIQQEEEEGIT